jgi:hypothetical protein
MDAGAILYASYLQPRLEPVKDLHTPGPRQRVVEHTHESFALLTEQEAALSSRRR